MFEKNVAVLKERYPELFELVMQPISLDHITVTRASNGDARLLIQTECGETLPLHNEESPTDVASRTAEEVLKFGGVFVLLGMGLGYLAKALVERLGNESALVIFEADPGIFKTALQELDLTKVLSHPRVKVLVGEEANVEEWARHYMAKTGRHVRPLRFEPAFRLAPDLYQKKFMHGLVHPILDNLSNWATAERFGKLVTKNCLQSLHLVIGTNGAQGLKEIFSGIPAALVAGGPSLGKNVQYLKQAKGRMIIIAADTILGYLLKCHITPDFVVTVDPQLDTYKKFKGVNIPEGCALLFHPTGQGQVPLHFPGKKFVTDTHMGVYAWLREFWPNKGNVESLAQCQVHLGFNLAEWMGCDPIIMVGQDLCFTDQRMHVSGGGYLPKKREDELVNQGPTLTDIFRNPVRTSLLYLRYKHTFEKKVAAFPGSVWNCTEGGLHITGTKVLRLQDGLETLSPSIKVDVPKTLSRVSADDLSPNWEGLVSEIRSTKKDFFRLQRVARHVSAIIEKIASERERTSEVSQSLSRLTYQAERLTNLVPRYGKSLGLLNLVDFDLELYLNRYEAEEVDEIEDECERLDKQLERGLRYYREMGNAAALMHQDVSSLLTRLEQLQHLERLKNTELNQEDLLDLVEGYVALEMYESGRTWLDRLTTHLDPITMGERVAWLSVYIPFQLQQWDVAYEWALEAKKHFPNHSELMALFDDVMTTREAWHHQVAAMDQETSQTNTSPLDPGDFYFRIGQFAEAMTHYRVAADSIQLTENMKGEAWYRFAKAAQAAGDTTHCMEALEQALMLSPADFRVYYDLGVMALQESRLEIAERFFEKGTEVSLEDPAFCEAVGAVLCAAGFPEIAIPFYERALLGSPGNGELLDKINETYQSIFEAVPSA